MSFKGKEFSFEMIQFVVNLKHYFDSEKRNGPTVSTKNSILRTAKGLGIGEATVKRIMANYNKNEQIIVPDSSKVRGKPAYRIAINLQPTIRQYIRSKNLNGQRISVDKLRSHLNESYDADIPTVTLWRALKLWGFAFGEGQRRSALKERDYVILARRKYLRSKRANRNRDGSLKRPEVYLDETYINKNHSSRFTWYLSEDGPWVNKPSGKGPRFIIVNAITHKGWVKGAELVFQAKKATGDYHGQMNWENFSRWFIHQLLPTIPANSLIIMDNAKYHNVFVENAFPAPTTRKTQMQEWLKRNDIPSTEDMLKPELCALCKRFAPAPEFMLDKIAQEHGHTILRTPQYHPELQPIETCWAIVKNYMADNCDFTMQNMRIQLPRALSKVSSQICKKLILKSVEQEEDYWKEDEKLYNFDDSEQYQCVDSIGEYWDENIDE